MFRRRLIPLLSVCALVAMGAFYASGAIASSVGDGVTVCAKGNTISYSPTGVCKSSETRLVLAANGDAQALDDDVVILQGEVADLEARVAALEAAAS